MANKFLMNFVVAKRRKVGTFQVEHTAEGTEIYRQMAYALYSEGQFNYMA